ncbi:hypothetical protein ABMA32_03140 [Mesorhizobium sp. VNQ89]|uniref:hypothetical protein n=1 Tax=Mesorhizobium quangtriensis TaxID=3157709 RepID=UPI0032B7A568
MASTVDFHIPSPFDAGKMECARWSKRQQTLAVVAEVLFHSRVLNPRERIMAKGQMKAKKETRKPKKDAKKPAVAAPALKAAPVAATRQKDK